MFRRPILFILLLSTFTGAGFAQRRPIAPRPIVPSPYSVLTIATAFAGDRFLTVWAQHTPGGGTHINGVFSDADGRRVSAASFPVVMNVQGVYPPPSLQLLGLGDAYALFWTEFGHAGSRHMVELDLDGAVTRHISVPYTPRSIQETYAWNGTHFIGMFMQGDRTDGIVFRRDGTLVQSVPLERVHDDRTAVPSGDGFLVFTGGRGGAIAQRVDADGASRRVAFLHTFGSHVVAADAEDGDALAVWAIGQRLQAARITPGLDVGTRYDLPVSGVPAHVTRTPSGFRVVARSGDDESRLYAIDLAADGAPRAIIDLQEKGRATPERVASNDRAILIAVPSVRSIAIAANGDVHTEALSIAPLRQSDPLAVVANGRFLVTWIDSPGSASIARAATVNVRGETTTTTTPAQNVTGVTGKLAWNGSTALLVTQRANPVTGTRIMGTRLSANGVAYEREPFTIASLEPLEWWPQPSPRTSVSWTGDRWIVAWIHQTTLFTAEVAATGHVSAPRRFEVPLRTESGSGNVITRAALAWNGRDVLLVWQNQQQPDWCFEWLCDTSASLHATRLDERGQSRDNPVLLARDVERSDLSVASSGEEFVVLEGGRTSVIGTDEHDQLIAEQLRTLFEYPGTVIGDLTWDGAEYVAALRYGVYESHLSLYRLDRDARPARRAPAYMQLNRADLPEPQTRPSVAADRVMGAAIAVHEGLGPAETAHVTVVRESELVPIVAPPAAPVVERKSLNVYSSILSWEPVTDAEGYVLEVFFEGIWRKSATMPADSTSVTVWGTQLSRVRAFNAGGFSF